MDREDAVVHTGIAHSLKIVVYAVPQVGCPDLNRELATQEDRRGGKPAAQIEDAHAGAEIERRGQPFGEPQ